LRTPSNGSAEIDPANTSTHAADAAFVNAVATDTGVGEYGSVADHIAAYCDSEMSRSGTC
jgi:hypothetical protein